MKLEIQPEPGWNTAEGKIVNTLDQPAENDCPKSCSNPDQQSSPQGQCGIGIEHPVIKPFPQFPCPLDFGNDARVIRHPWKVWKELFLIMIEDVSKGPFRTDDYCC